MGLPAIEQTNLDLLQRLLNEVDYGTKYTIFFKDVLNHEKEMLDKNRKCVKDYLSTFKIFKPLGFILLTIFIAIALILLSSEYNFIFSIDELHNPKLLTEIKDTILALFETSTLPLDVDSNLIKSILKIDLIYIFIFGVYDIYLILRFPIDLFKFLKARNKMFNFLKSKEEIISKDYAQKVLPELNKAIILRKKVLNDFFTKINLDSSLRNRENVDYIKELAEINKDKSISINDLQKFILKNGLVKEPVDTELWCKALLVYDVEFPYYKKGNPFIDYSKKKKSEFFTILMLLLFPLTIYYFAFKLIIYDLKTLFKSAASSPSIQNSVSENIPSTYQSSYRDYNEPESVNTFLYHDMQGTLCQQGGIFYDGRNNPCGPDSCFYDFKGNWCVPGGAFYDSRGFVRYPGEPFYDGKDTLIFPQG